MQAHLSGRSLQNVSVKFFSLLDLLKEISVNRSLQLLMQKPKLWHSQVKRFFMLELNGMHFCIVSRVRSKGMYKNAGIWKQFFSFLHSLQCYLDLNFVILFVSLCFYHHVLFSVYRLTNATTGSFKHLSILLHNFIKPFYQVFSCQFQTSFK